MNLHIYPSVFKNESRILKETKSCIDLGITNTVVVCALHTNGVNENDIIDNNRSVKRLKIPFGNAIGGKQAMFKLFFFNIYTIKYGLKIKPQLINCHSLTVLVSGVVLKLFTGAKLVYDTHELETEKAGMGNVRRIIAKLWERFLIQFVNGVITVSPSINDWYIKTYKLNNCVCVRNIPYQQINAPSKNSILRDEFKIESDAIIYIYQGLFSRGRGIELMLSTFEKLPINNHLILMGYGPLEVLIQKYTAQFPNIHFKAAVAPADIIKYTSSCDVGIVLIENISLSYYYSLANKVFEYMLSGLPIITSNFPDMQNLVTTYNCGWSIEPSIEQLKKIILQLTTQEIENKKNNLSTINKNLCWEKEECKLQQFYKQLV